MFPSKVDLTKDECRGALRRLELEAYSSVVSTFRAQGNLDGNKQTVLDQLRRFFKISEDRHKAEIRRVANNEKLTKISEQINGKSYDLEWIKEGHRSYPLISRAPSCTALHILAEHASKVAAYDNTELPAPIDSRRERSLDVEISAKPIITDDPTKPPQLSSASTAIFGLSRKDLKRSIDSLVTLHPHTKKKHYHHLKPPPPAPHVKIQHLYQTLNTTKRPRKSFTKKSKTKATSSSASSSKQSPSGRMQFAYPGSSPDEKHFDGAELQRHLTSQLMPPPPPMKLAAYTQQQQPLPTSKKELNLLNKMNHHHQQQQHSLEPQAHYIPNNRLKSELLLSAAAADHHHHHQTTTPVRARSGRSKSMSVPSKSNYSAKYANGAGGSRINNSSSMDHIPDPQIIFNTTSHSSSSSSSAAAAVKMESSSMADSMPLESNDMDMSPAITSPLQLLSTAASCTPKLKVTAPINHHLSPPSSSMPSSSLHQHHHHQQQQQTHHSIQIQQQSPNIVSAPSVAAVAAAAQMSCSSSPSLTSPTTSNTLKTVQNRAIKIIPANTKPMIIKPQQNADINKSPQQQQQQQQTLISTTTPSKFKIQKIQLVMNKNQDGTSSGISPSATIVSGKAGQLVLSGKSITNTYQVGTKTPYTILSGGKVGGAGGGGGPKVIVQTIDRNFAQAQKDGAVTDASEKIIVDSQRITESTPIDFLPAGAVTSSFPKVIIQKSTAAPKQIKLKLGPGSIVNSKIIKGPLPGNLKIQRNINTKGFTVLNTSQIVQIQSNQAAAAAAAAASLAAASSSAASLSTTTTTPTAVAAAAAPVAPVVVVSNNTESTKTDWEQELDDANRTKENNKDRIVVGAATTTPTTATESNGNSSSGGGSFAKKPRIDETQAVANEEVVQNNNDNIIIETSEIESSNNLIYAESLPQIDAVTAKQQPQQTTTPEPISEFVYISAESDLKHAAAVDESGSSPLPEIINGEDIGDSAKLNGEFVEVQDEGEEEERDDDDERPHNGAEAYENLVKSLEAECESEYMKEIAGDEEESQIDENFRLIDSSGMLDPSIAFSRESEGIFQ